MTQGEDKPDAQDIRIGLVASRFNQFIVEQLLEGARDALARHHIAQGFQHLVWAPGAFELPLLADQLAREADFLSIGCWRFGWDVRSSCKPLQGGRSVR